MQLQKLLSALPFYSTNQDIKNIDINGIKMDNREIEKGDMFVCIKGFTVDGHSFAKQAAQSGAVAIVSEKPLDVSPAITIIVPDTTKALAILATEFYHHPTHNFPLIGITGTNGKTTTTYLLEEIFKAHGKKTGLIGTIQMKIGDKVYGITNTTPDALHLQHNFHKMAREEVDIVMMEVSSHALDLGRVYGSDFDIAVFTNLSQDHLDYHKDMDDYLRAKTLLFTGLGNSYKNKKFAVLNVDDDHSKVIQNSTAQPVITYGIQTNADVMATNISFQLKNTTFTLKTPVGETTIRSNLIGTFNIYNMLAAASVAILRKVSLETIKYALEKIRGVDGRFEQVTAGQNFAVIVDYAHTPDSLENVLQTVKEFAKQRIFTIVGTGGDRDRTKRPLMAKVATKYSDLAILTSDNPRTEEPGAILQDMTNGLVDTNYTVIENRKEAIQYGINMAEAGDIVLIAGKGHETYQEINGVRYDFDDRIVAEEAIRQKGTN
ncbi:UDP-N-acetylmuramoyl-L-alanyl-D-glutamate--2,6-diaminopimelate ligase [Pseudogracilibacillus sp. SO30301A]|uniref:UDP-N-acetylmuramoyl-L-alanyl-D-glutamate--2, 6-diaminopimelate ligase n=1 Tax=Pseudogracilibacillus sp. SO30301A TaxID=3098291 RepID=UPI00300DFA1D